MWNKQAFHLCINQLLPLVVVKYNALPLSPCGPFWLWLLTSSIWVVVLEFHLLLDISLNQDILCNASIP